MPYISPKGSFAQAMPPGAFDDLIAFGGINMTWAKSHSCPCVGDTGSAQVGSPTCQVCYGRGFYWDNLQGPFILLLTLISWIGRNVDMGEKVDPDYGMIYQGHPILTIPHPAQPIWTEANTRDVLVEPDTNMRFQATLRVNENEIVPAWHVLGSVTVAPTGAVVVEDPNINQPVKTGISYTVNGGQITLNPNSAYPDGWPNGTSYTVEYYSPAVFVIEEPFGGLSHVRPFGQGLLYPKRWKLTLLDMYLRTALGNSSNII